MRLKSLRKFAIGLSCLFFANIYPVSDPVKEGKNGPETLSKNSSFAHTKWKEGYGRGIDKQNKFNRQIEAAISVWPDMDPIILKSMLSQESGFGIKRRNRHGYKGISQLGWREAKYAGLKVGRGDERYDPDMAIKACVKVTRQKATHLHQVSFSKYGRPAGDEYWKFVAAAYNAGEGTIARAINIAYQDKNPKSVKFSDLLQSKSGNPQDTPLYRALPKRWRRVSKYTEIREYASNVVKRARQ